MYQTLRESLLKSGEFYAAACMENWERSHFYRLAHAQKVWWQECDMPEYDGGSLYPCGRRTGLNLAAAPQFSYTYYADVNRMEKISPQAAEVFRNEDVHAILAPCGWHLVGGAGYVHSMPHYIRVLTEGLESYAARIEKVQDADMRDGLLEVLEGIRIWRDRCLTVLKDSGAPEKLISALQKVPFQPAENLYEALVGWNFIYYVDLCDNPGPMDQDLVRFYQGEDMTDVFRCFFRNVDENDGWSLAIGPNYNPLTLQILHAIKGIRRPSVELRVTENMPPEIWQAAQEAVASGCGNPSFYNEPAYQKGLADYFPQIPQADRLRFNGGGCTETMLAGISNVGSLEAGINIAHIFSEHMRETLANSPDFETFFAGLTERIRRETLFTLQTVNQFRKFRADHRPQPIRTLLVDDCIDRGLDFNAGGARWNWSVVNLAGVVNVADSLSAVRSLVYDKKIFDGAAFIEKLDAQDPSFLAMARSCPAFGVDDPAANAMARRLMDVCTEALKQETPYLGLAFVPSSIQFTTYTDAGRNIPATPDGRSAGAPLADCLGAVHGKDQKGATALLGSAACLCDDRMIGTPVMNLRLQKSHMPNVQALVSGYFQMGGLQLQITCVDRQELLDAMEHPEKHGNLIVRVGGYAEYFVRLSRDLQNAVLQRTEYGA